MSSPETLGHAIGSSSSARPAPSAPARSTSPPTCPAGSRSSASAATRAIDLLLEQAHEFRPRFVCLTDPEASLDPARLPPGCELLRGIDGIARMVADEGVDTVVSAIVGAAGLEGTWAALEAGKTVAVANKETFVLAGRLVTELAARTGGRLLPVDSEHSAIFQAIQGSRSRGRARRADRLGGPFRGKSLAELERVTVEQALKHPTWSMGRRSPSTPRRS